MSLDSVRVKDPAHVRAGIAGAKAHWGRHGRILRLNQLDEVTRAIVESILDGAANAAKAAAETPKTA